MEEILASIRRIIADDQAPQQPAARAPAPSPAPASAPAPRREEPRFADLDGLQPRANPARERAPVPRLTIDAPAHSFAPQAPAP
ncbi:MAG: hypothetical protein JWN93_432, partial [Hyphomicrobiales bacterium]|nr:hypothetical protein [Hyphomicrobiales bacterium]